MLPNWFFIFCRNFKLSDKPAFAMDTDQPDQHFLNEQRPVMTLGFHVANRLLFHPRWKYLSAKVRGVIMPLPLLNVFKHSQFNWFSLHPPKTTGGEQFGFLHFCENVLLPPRFARKCFIASCRVAHLKAGHLSYRIIYRLPLRNIMHLICKHLQFNLSKVENIPNCKYMCFIWDFRCKVDQRNSHHRGVSLPVSPW